MQERTERQSELRLWQHGAVFLLAYAVSISRRPDAILRAQFFAEDGHVWFADAYNRGWYPALFQAHTGYFQTLPRLGAAIALLAPFSLAPLVLNLIAFAVQALPANLLLSSRLEPWGNLRFRAALAGIYLALPNCAELSYGITESQWLLALCAFLLLSASPPGGIAGKAIDLAILMLCGLTGPFCIFLTPIALFMAWWQRDRWHWLTAGCLAALCLVQAWALLVVDPTGRPHLTLGVSPALLARILAGQIYLGVLLGDNGLATSTSPRLLFVFVFAAIAGTTIVAVCLSRSAMPMKLFVLFSTAILAALLVSPVTPANVSAWESLASASGAHYWFFPSLAFAWSLLWCLYSRVKTLKVISYVLLIFMCFGIVRAWVRPPFIDLHFARDAQRFETASPGTAVVFPENPQGWDIRLVKRQPSTDR
jgi:hypothetical protein